MTVDPHPRADSTTASVNPAEKLTDRLAARLADLETPFVRLAIAGLAIVTAFALWLLIQASRRGLDLTDEGIYLNIYRYWRHPELTFTGAPVLLGPVFQLLGWSVPSLRILKLILVVGSAATLGLTSARYVFWHLPPSRLRREKEVLIALVSVVGSFSVYSWLPQTPGYNDLAIVFSALCIALALNWAMTSGTKADVLATLLGNLTILLLFVKWPSAIFTSAGITAFIFLSGRGRRFLRLLAFCAGSGVATLVLIQLIAGQLIDRVTTLTASSDTLLRGTGLREAYIEPYAQNIIDTVSRLTRVGGPILVPAFAAAVVLIVLRRPIAAGIVYAAGLTILVPWTRWKGNLTGGEVNVVALESTFPIFFIAALGVVALMEIARRRQSGPLAGIAASRPDHPDVKIGRSLVVGLALLSLAPLLQAIGTGNPMFRIAFCAGGAWAAAVGALMLVAVERGGPAFFLPAGSGLVMVCAVGFATGIQGLWTDSFRVGPLWKQTVSVPGVAPLKGMTLDPSAADLIVKTRAVLERNGYLGAPGISTSNGTGLTFALSMPHPPAGLFIEEPLPNVLRSRIREACKIEVISSSKPPVVISLGDERPIVATEELQACGIDFPAAYSSERVVPVAGGYNFLRDVGVTVWMPKR